MTSWSLSVLLCVFVVLEGSRYADAVHLKTTSYKAATVIRSALPANGASPTTHQMKNLAAFAQYVETASEWGAKLITFPEWSLGTSKFEDGRDAIVPYAEPIPSNTTTPPCLQPLAGAPVASNASCLARTHNITIVLNMVATGWPTFDGKVWNTEVVFGPAGNIIARYYKSHPFFPKVFDTPPSPDYVTFESSSPELAGITFGLFVCKDILYQSPAVDYVKNGIKNFPYSIALDSFLGTGAEEAWSWLHGANLMVADDGKAHGGIYSKGKDITAKRVPFATDSGTLCLADVPVL